MMEATRLIAKLQDLVKFVGNKEVMVNGKKCDPMVVFKFEDDCIHIDTENHN